MVSSLLKEPNFLSLDKSKKINKMKRFLFVVLCLVIVQGVFAQTKSISGTVFDQTTKESLPFASIHVPNTLVGTMTNEVKVANYEK